MFELPRRLAYVPATSLRPAERNAKLHDLVGIRDSIVRFGFNDTLIVDERTGRMVGGHGRLEALVSMQESGYTDPATGHNTTRAPDGIVVDDDGGWLVPVLRGWASSTDGEAEALNIALNKLTENGGWHNKTLAAMVEDINAEDGRLLDAMGMGGDDLDALLAQFDPDTLNRDPGEPDDHGPGGEANADAPLGRDDDPPVDEAGATITCPACAHRFETRL